MKVRCLWYPSYYSESSREEDDSWYGLLEGAVVFNYSSLPLSIPEEERSEFITPKASKICSHCHEYTTGTWLVKRNKKLKGRNSTINTHSLTSGSPLRLSAITHLGACKAVADRKCESSEKCGMKKHHTEEVEQEREEKQATKVARKVVFILDPLVILQTARLKETADKREKKREKQEANEQASNEKILNKAKKLEAKLKNEKLVKIATNSVSEHSKGGPNLFNKLLPLSKALSVMDLTSLHFPGHSPDDKLNLELAHAIQWANASQFSTKEVAIADLEANIDFMNETRSQVKVTVSLFICLLLKALLQQLDASIGELQIRRRHKVITTSKAALKRTRSESDLQERVQQERVQGVITQLQPLPKKPRLELSPDVGVKAVDIVNTADVDINIDVNSNTNNHSLDAHPTVLTNLLQSLQQSLSLQETIRTTTSTQASDPLPWIKEGPWDGAAARFTSINKL